MSLILNIDTATEVAIVSVSNKEDLVQSITNSNQKDHASFLQPAIKEIFSVINFKLDQLDAISVTAGPGSYTGLRVGMASAKGLCYALNIPLITLSTLEVMALSSIIYYNETDNNILYAPMIDARRMEVFTAVYDKELNENLQPCALILNDDSFVEMAEKNKIVFSGSGSSKLRSVLQHPNAIFSGDNIKPEAMVFLANKYFEQGKFADLYNAEPFYGKEFYTP